MHLVKMAINMAIPLPQKQEFSLLVGLSFNL